MGWKNTSASVAELSRIPVSRFFIGGVSRLRDLSSTSRQDRKIKADLNGRACETSDAVQGTLTAKNLHYLHSHGMATCFEKHSSKPEFNERFGGQVHRAGKSFPSKQ